MVQKNPTSKKRPTIVEPVAQDGDPIGQMQLPERCANLCFGWAKCKRLFMASYMSIYSLFTNAQGIPGT